MTKIRSFPKAAMIVSCLVTMLAPTLATAATPSGTKIQATATAQYRSSSGELMPTATSNTVTVTVAQSVSVIVNPPSQRKHVSANSSADFGLTITNTGGASDTFDLSAASTYGSSATIYLDGNGDGYRQSTETTVVASTGALSPGGSFACVVRTQLPTSGSVESDIVTFTAKSRADNTKTAQSVLTLFKTTADASYVTSWLVNASYANSDRVTRLSRDYLGGESSVAPIEGTITGDIMWQKLTTNSAYVDLGTPYGNPKSCAGYAFAYVYTPSALTANVWIGSDDGVKVWLNGNVLWTNDVYRIFAPDADRFTANLVQGWNKILVKVSQGDVDWGFSVRICDSSGQPISGLVYALSPTAMGDTTAPVISNVTITPDVSSAKVEWDTNELSSSLVDYGTSSALGTDYSDIALMAHHTATLTGLTPGTTYYLSVGSADGNGNVAWARGYSFRTTVAPVASGPYIQTWLVNGYYPNADQATRLSKDYLVYEASLAPVEGAISAGRKWFRLDAPTNYLDMANAFDYPRYCAGYAACYVYSPVSQSVGMWIGSNDGTKIWLNGSVVWFNDVYRSFVFDKDKTTVTLKAGWNRLLIRLSQGVGSWGLSVKFCDSAGLAIPGVAYELSPTPMGDTTATVISNVKITPDVSPAKVEWDTNELSSTLVDYGTSSALGTDYSDIVLVAHHTATLTGLAPGTTYYLSVGSADGNGGVAWASGYSFQTKVAPVANGPYIQTWLVNGYYPNANQTTRLSKEYLGCDAWLAPVEGAVSGSKKWFRLDAPTNYLDMANAFGYPIYCAGYAACYVYSPVSQSVGMWIGSNDGTKIWLNGNVVWFNDVYRSFVFDKDKTTVTLNAGWNRLLIRLSQGLGSWGLSVKFCDPAGNQIPGLGYWIAPGM